MVATFVLWLLGMAARLTGQHFKYQANSVRKRHVLSVIYLGLRVANDQRFKFDLEALPSVADSLHANIHKHAEGC